MDWDRDRLKEFATAVGRLTLNPDYLLVVDILSDQRNLLVEAVMSHKNDWDQYQLLRGKYLMLLEILNLPEEILDEYEQSIGDE
jgi:hypothetical protein